MDKIIKEKLLKIIRDSINETVYEEMKRLPEILNTREENYQKTKAQRAQYAHEALFGTEEEQIQHRIHINESTERPKVSQEELEKFESDTKRQFPEISFNKQNVNNQIISFPIQDGKTDAVASGTISAKGGEKIGFIMSLLNGFNIVEDNNKTFEINKDTKDIFGKILNFYETVFKEKFSEIINPKEENGEEGKIEQNATVEEPAPAPAPMSSQNSEPIAPGAPVV
jgi:hypothetical protein